MTTRNNKSIDLCLKATRVGMNNIYYNGFKSENEETSWVADAIEKYVSDGGSYNEICVLVRIFKFAESLISELRKRNIPYSITGKRRLFGYAEVIVVTKLMAWLSFKGFYNEKGLKNSITGDKLLESALTDWQTHFPNSSLNSNVRRQLENWKAKSLSGGYDDIKSVYEAMLNILNFKQLDEADKKQMQVILHFGQFSTMLNNFEHSLRLGGSKRNWEEDFNTLCFYLHEAKKSYGTVSEEVSNSEGVAISTIHQFKGLDRDCVFMPYLIDGHYPSSQMGKSKSYMVDVSSFVIGRYAGTREDEANIFYEGISRPKHSLVMTSNYGKGTEISPFLKDSLQSNFVIKLNDKYSFPDFQIDPTTHSVDELKSYGVSEIMLNHKCPRLYFLREICGYSSKFNQMLGYGKCLHFCVQQIAEKTTMGIDPHTIVDDIVEKHLHLPFAPNTDNVIAKQKAKKMLHDYIDRNPDDMANMSDTEIPITIKFHDYLVEGKIDAIIVDNDGKDIRENKTSEEVMSKEDMSLQVQIYAVGLTGNNSFKRGSVAFLDDGTVHTVDVGKESLKAAQQIIDDCVSGMERGYYPPKPSTFCEKCDMKNICKFAK
ncbi:3'-5' exonuclease [Methanolobus bombayensis]|uniref:3'-5' exonuclease n=1 Tax=Methanolobus bombayensis TaxID=38023 RepID=UPI001AE5AA32|nr:3'-5' exonuclease [Methanolobus bombayensis]MBP1909195.1 CRISPR/Cas system-associated exonuclease Cas4 (RecB family) [Methanolobus bombayensis]